MPTTDIDEPKYKLRFDMTINLGHALTMFTFLVVAITQWNLMDKRVLVLEEFRLAQRERDVSQDLSSKDKFQEVRDALTELRRSVEKVGDKVGVAK
jgi:hypothetical protein